MTDTPEDILQQLSSGAPECRSAGAMSSIPPHWMPAGFASGNDDSDKITPLKVVPGLSDAEQAAEIRAAVTAAAEPLLREMSRAKRLGFDVLLGIATDATGRSILNQLKIVKEF